jgi:hypothetical protein
MMGATFAWAVFLEGYLGGAISWVARLAFGAAALAIIFAPTGSAWWWAGCGGAVTLAGWVLARRPRALQAAP